MVEFRDMLEKTKFLMDRNITFDFAFPAPWANEIYEKTGLYPHGVVWLYDARMFGRPYPITLKAWMIMKIAGIEIPKLKVKL